MNIRSLPVTFVLSPKPVTERERAQYLWAVEQGWRAVLQNAGGELNNKTAPMNSGKAFGADGKSNHGEYTTVPTLLHCAAGSKPEVA